MKPKRAVHRQPNHGNTGAHSTHKIHETRIPIGALHFRVVGVFRGLILSLEQKWRRDEHVAAPGRVGRVDRRRGRRRPPGRTTEILVPTKHTKYTKLRFRSGLIHFRVVHVFRRPILVTRTIRKIADEGAPHSQGTLDTSHPGMGEFSIRVGHRPVSKGT
jgi:hypothetical protein